MLDVHRLRLLRELQRRGTLAEVAAALRYSPSAVSQQLALLAREAGTALLEPAGRGVRLTPAAHLLVVHADAVLTRLEQAEAELAALGATAAGPVRAAVFQSVLLALVPGALDLLAQRHPAVRAQFVQSEPVPSLSALRAREVDVVVGEEFPGLPEARHDDLDELDLARDEVRLALPRAGPWARGDGATTLADLAEAPWVVEPPDTAPGRWVLSRCREAGFEPAARIVTPDPLLHAHLVETGHAVAMLPDMLWRARDHRSVDLVRLPDRPARRLFTVVRRGAAGHPVVRAFRECLHEVARRPGP